MTPLPHALGAPPTLISLETRIAPEPHSLPAGELAGSIAAAAKDAETKASQLRDFHQEVKTELADNEVRQSEYAAARKAASDAELERNKTFKAYYDTCQYEARVDGHYDKKGAWHGGTDTEKIETARKVWEDADLKLAQAQADAAESEIVAQAAWWRAVGKDEAAEELEK